MKEAAIMPLRAANCVSSSRAISPRSSMRMANQVTRMSATLKAKMMKAMKEARGAAARMTVRRYSPRFLS